MIYTKVGVMPRSLTLVCGVANVASDLGLRITITAGRNGTHKVGSLHYVDAALDLRTRNLSNNDIRLLVKALKAKFPFPTYDVILESNHIHLEDNRALQIK